ncbi:MAG: ABC transporter permease [Candidatus Sumerlaeaceae bacterium]|nr:ABC transporter permease [Candidatus Sumerlaeaceae bacterium]
MVRHILQRLGLAVPLVIGASFITFSILYFVPGDPVVMMLGDRANDRQLVEKLRNELRLNDPFFVRYGRFVGDLAKGDLGRSYRTNHSIAADLREALPATMELACAGVLLAMLIGVISGTVSALRQYSYADFALMIVAMIGVSIPVFWLALILSYLLAFRYNILEMAGRVGGDFLSYQSPTGFFIAEALWYRNWDMLGDALRHLALPALTLGLIGSALVARMTRSSVLEAKSQDFVRTARAKGLKRHQVLWHTMRNAMLPVITVIGLQFGALMGGAIITEEVFAWPGVGTYLIQAIRYRDIVAVQGTVMVLVLIFVLVNLAVDLLYLAVDPRVRE